MLSLFIPSNTSFGLALLLVPIELLSYIFKSISLGVRLFVNLMAGHTLLKVFEVDYFKNIMQFISIFFLDILENYIQSKKLSLYFSENYLHSNHSLFYTEYTIILTFLFITAILSIIIVLFSYILAVQKPETKKLATYEYGFEPYEDARHLGLLEPLETSLPVLKARAMIDHMEKLKKENDFGLHIIFSPGELLNFEIQNRNNNTEMNYPPSVARVLLRKGGVWSFTDVLIRRPTKLVNITSSYPLTPFKVTRFENQLVDHVMLNTFVRCPEMGDLRAI